MSALPWAVVTAVVVGTLGTRAMLGLLASPQTQWQDHDDAVGRLRLAKPVPPPDWWNLTELRSGSWVGIPESEGARLVSPDGPVTFAVDPPALQPLGQRVGHAGVSPAADTTVAAISETRRRLSASIPVRQLDTHAFPAAAVVKITFNFSSEQFICSGALISPYVVLTAAHCVYRQSSATWATNMVVYPGETGVVYSGGAASSPLPLLPVFRVAVGRLTRQCPLFFTVIG